MNNKSDPSTVMAHAVALATTIVGFIIAYVPSEAHYERISIFAGAVVIAAVTLIAHAIRYRAKGTSAPVAVEELAAQVAPLINVESTVKTVLADIGAKQVAAPSGTSAAMG